MTTVRWRSETAVAVSVFLVSALVMILMRPLLPIDETRYLTVAWEMWNDGSWSVPHLNGAVYSHKPPMLFWIINLVWSVTGVSEIAARLVGPAFGALCVGLVAVLARALWPADPARAGRAALIAATTTLFALYASATMFDTMLGAATLSAMLAAWFLAAAPRAVTAAALGAALAFGVLAKGPVILLHALPATLLMPLWADRSERAATGRYFRMVALALAVAVLLVALWLVPVLIFGDSGYREDVLWRQTAGRMVGSFAHDRPVWFFAALLPLFLWPWAWSRPGLAALSPASLLSTPQARFLAITFGSAFLVFSLISGKQAHYLIPQLPVLALLLSRVERFPDASAWRILPVVPALVLVTGAVLLKLDVLPASLADGNPIGTGGVVLAAIVAAVAAGLALRARPPLAVWASMAPLTLLAVHLLGLDALRTTDDRARIGELLASASASGVATMDRGYAGQFSFAGRLAEPVTVLAGPGEAEAWIDVHPGGALFARKPVGADGLSLIANERFHGDEWYVYRVGPAEGGGTKSG